MAVKWLFTPVTELESRIEEKIKFRTELNGKVVRVGGFRLSELGPKKVNEVENLKVKDYCHEQEEWKIQVLLDGKPTGLYLKPIHLLEYNRIIFEYSTLDDGSRTLCARGLMSSGRLAQLRGLGTVTRRNRQYGSSERKYGLKDIGKVQLAMTGKRKDKAPTRRTASHASSNISKDMYDGATDIVNVAVGCAGPVSADEKAIFHYKTLEYHSPSIIGGREVAKISPNDVDSEIRQWEHAIVGHLVGEDYGDDVKCYVREHWRDFGSFHTYQLRNAFFIFVFTNGADKFKILEQGQLFIHGRPFILKRWIPAISLDPSVFLATVPVWVKFPHLNLQLWSDTSLSKISSLLGQPLFTDGPTAAKEMLQYARVCIEIKSGDSLPDSIPIFVNDALLYQAVIYEWDPRPFLYHDSSACPLTSKCGASLKESGDRIDLLLDDADEKSYRNYEKEKVPFQHCPPLRDEDNDSDVCHEGSSTTDEDSSNVEDIFSSEDECDLSSTGSSTAVEASQLLLQSPIDRGIIEVPENEEEYSPVACSMNSERNAATNWLYHYVFG